MATTTEANVDGRAHVSVAHDRATAGAAILLRLAAAYLWYENLSWKNPPDFGKSDGGGLYGFTHAAVTNPVLGVWSSVIENVVLPNFVIFGWFALITETALAIFLFLGLATRHPPGPARTGGRPGPRPRPAAPPPRDGNVAAGPGLPARVLTPRSAAPRVLLG